MSIQAAIRGAKARLEVAGLDTGDMTQEEIAEAAALSPQQLAAASVLQGGINGAAARAQIAAEGKLAMACVLQANVRGYLGRQEAMERSTALAAKGEEVIVFLAGTYMN